MGIVTPPQPQGPHTYATLVDLNGNTIGTVALSDGAQFGSISGESDFLFNNGGPVDVNGLPTQLSFDRQRGYLGKFAVTKTLTSTLVGDTTLTFSAAPKTVMPGHALRLTGGAVDEYVYVTSSYAPSMSTTVIPLASPVVNAGQTTAVYDVFSSTGPSGLGFTPVGVGMTALAMPAPAGAMMTTATSSFTDGVASGQVLQIAQGGIAGTNIIDRLRTPTVFKAFNAQAITASSANTPTSIWTPASGKKFRLMGYWFSTTAAAGIVFHDLAAQGGTGLLPIPSPISVAAGLLKSPPIGNGFLSAAANNQLWVDGTIATTLTGFCFGVEE